jgi:hypothetical protein
MYRLISSSQLEHIDRLLGEIHSLRSESAADPGYGAGKSSSGGAAGVSPVPKGPTKKPARPPAGKK